MFIIVQNLLINLQSVRKSSFGTAVYIFDIFSKFLQLKKNLKPPEIPSKHVRNWVPKVLEQRRQGLELYLQVLSYTLTPL